jgi:hypothetical protein
MLAVPSADRAPGRGSCGAEGEAVISRAAIIASCLAFGCAQSLPGVDPPGDEVFFPIGMTISPGAEGQPLHLAVLSSNFDQRFNSGMITTYWIGNLFNLANCGPGGTLPPIGDICIMEGRSLRDAQSDTIRVFSFGGDLIYVPSNVPTEGNLFVAARGRNRLTMINVDTTEGGDVLDCSNDGFELAVGSDCTRAFAADTGFADPFSLAHIPKRERTTADFGHADLIAIGHVATRDDGTVNFGAVSLADVEVFRTRPGQELAGEQSFANPIEKQEFGPFGGISGVAFAGNVLDLTDVVLTANFRSSPDVSLAAFTPAVFPSGLFGLTLAQDTVNVLRLSNEIGAIEMRSLAVAPDSRRAYASVRFFAPGDSYNAGIAVIDLTGEQMTVVSVLEFGDELQQPYLREVTIGTETSRLLYVGDIRRDKIYIVDVTTDAPFVVHEIDGRGTRMIDGKPVQARLLDSPSQIVFASEGTQTLGFVSNFGNSTLAVLDVTDPDPRMHRIVARLGRNIDPEGEMEKP